MRPLLLAPALAFLFAHLPTAEEQLAFGVPKGAEVEKSFTLLFELSLAEQTQTFDGEEVVDMDDSDVEVQMTMESKLVFLDEYREVSGSRARVLAREFVTLEGGRTIRVRAPGIDEEDADQAESSLLGKTVVFTWSESEEGYGCAYDDDGRSDRELLSDLVADSDFCAFLPDGPVAKGDSWKVDARHFRQFSEPGGDVRLALEDEDEEDRERSRQLNENMSGELVATFEGTREEGDARVAVIALRAELESHAETSGEDEDGDPTETVFRLSVDLEGELLWSLAAGRPHSYRMEGDVGFELEETTTWDDDGDTHVLVARMKITGEYTLTGAWRAAD